MGIVLVGLWLILVGLRDWLTVPVEVVRIAALIVGIIVVIEFLIRGR